jgi:beta-glucosidase
MSESVVDFQPLPFAPCHARASEIVAQMTLEEKIALVGGERSFFIRPTARFGTPEVYMTDATGGIHIRETFDGADLQRYQPPKSTAMPCPLLLAATWNPARAKTYAHAVGVECKAQGIGILLGPGMNIYRQSQNGRNFEYMGEDPFLAARMVERFVAGMQSAGTMATLKHFLCNNTDWFRRKSNSIVEERAMHEIFMPAFEAGVQAGARAVMTAYNLFNGQWCGESDFVINGLLRKQLGFQWLVMSDWWSVWNGEALASSGQDLEMPHAVALKDAPALIAAGKVKVEDLERMCRSILTACFSMGLDGPVHTRHEVDWNAHVEIALQTAREGIVLLKNDGACLPIGAQQQRVLLCGPRAETVLSGGGSARVAGFDSQTLHDAMRKKLGDRLTYIADPSAEQLAGFDVVVCNIGTQDSEGWDRPFALPEADEALALRCVRNHRETVVVVSSGGGIRMTDWAGGARAVVHGFYPGQVGNVAMAEILIGDCNPSGKLPMTIEREFSDSPGFGYLPEGESLYTGFRDEEERNRAVWDLPYREGVFVGYRHYDAHAIEPLFPFGHGLSYTSFSYDDLAVAGDLQADGTVTATVAIKNVGACFGAEVVQLYVEPVAPRVPRPPRELKGFARIDLRPGETRRVALALDPRAFSYWDVATQGWVADPGTYRLRVGASSRDLRLSATITLR